MNRRRTTSIALAAGASLAVLLGGCGGDGEKADRTPGGEESAAAVELTLPSAQPGRCALPNAEALALNDTAFEGTVTQVDDVSATLEVDRWFKGEEADLVTVALPSAELTAGGLAVAFEEDATYLVSATDQAVSLCGFTAESTPQLEQLYVEAFPQE